MYVNQGDLPDRSFWMTSLTLPTTGYSAYKRIAVLYKMKELGNEMSVVLPVLPISNRMK